MLHYAEMKPAGRIGAGFDRLANQALGGKQLSLLEQGNAGTQ